MKITIDCGGRFCYPNGSFSQLPEAVTNKELRNSLFEVASSVIDELGENAELVELIKLHHGLNFNFGGYVVNIRVITLDPVVDGEVPSQRKATAELHEVTDKITEVELKEKILELFWKCIDGRRATLKQSHERLPGRTKSGK